MALIPCCDRCGTPNVQVVTVLDVDVCAKCVDDTRTFLATPPERSWPKRSARVEQALRVCAAKGRVTDLEIALANGEKRRSAYFRLMGIVRQGRLVHVGGGVFELPKPREERIGA